MQGALVKLGNADIANALAEGAVKAENEALKNTIAMLMCEIAQKDETIALYRWKEQRDRERALEKLREGSKKARRPLPVRIALAIRDAIK